MSLVRPLIACNTTLSNIETSDTDEREREGSEADLDDDDNDDKEGERNSVESSIKTISVLQ
jgi:hypothetical protein